MVINLLLKKNKQKYFKKLIGIKKIYIKKYIMHILDNIKKTISK